MRLIIKILLITLFVGIAQSCDEDPTQSKENTTSRTILVYMIATNSLSNYAEYDIDEMMEGIATIDNEDCHLLVYEVNYDIEPTLYEITQTDGIATKETIKTYSSDIKSTTIERMSEVIEDTRNLAPADSYGLILWSHATGWVRTLESSTATGWNRTLDSNSSIQTERIRPTDFGEDYGTTMTIDELASAIPDSMFYFIYADACYMGCIEIAYQLRNKTNFYISSPTETMVTGMPYDENIPCFFENTPNLVQACQNTYNYYASRSSYATISLVDCSKLEIIADLCQQIHANPQSEETIQIEEIQYYNRNSQPVLFDFLQYTTMLASQEQAGELYTLTNQAVIYKAATSSFLSININPDNYSGLSTYIMGVSSSINEQYYMTLDWYNKVYN